MRERDVHLVACAKALPFVPTDETKEMLVSLKMGVDVVRNGDLTHQVLVVVNGTIGIGKVCLSPCFARRLLTTRVWADPRRPAELL